MDKQANLTTRTIARRRTARLIAGLLVATLLVAASWPAAWAQEATPDDAAQADVIVADEPAVTEVTDVPAASEVTESQDDPELSEPTPAPTVVPVNADFLQTVASPASDALEPGATVEFDFDYQITTPRSSTTIVAELGGGSGQNGAWTVQVNAGGVWSEVGGRVQLTDAQYTDAGSTIPLSLIVTAPHDVAIDETITIWLSSSVTRFDGGIEQGVVATQPVASARAIPPPPTPTPTIVEPTLSCAGPADYDVKIGGALELTCEVTILDSRAGALVAVEPPSGWSVSSGDGLESSERLELGPFALDDGTPTLHTVPITVHAPAAAGVESALTIRLLEDSDAQTELDSKTIQLTTVVPADWKLGCTAGSTPAALGTSAEISCELPNAAWEFRGDRPAYTASTAEGWASNADGAIDEAAFSFSIPVPCTVANDYEQLSVSADLGNGMKFAASVSISLDRSATFPVPVLTHTDFDFGDSQWLGTSYAPAETTVTLTVGGATAPCVSADWNIQLNTSSFSNGEFEVDPTISFSTLESTGTTISPKPDGTVVPGAGATVVSGTGDGVIVVHLALSLPATIGAGTYTGDVEFSISAGP